MEGKPLPTLVYLAREKRPGYPHNFKAGAMNTLVSQMSLWHCCTYSKSKFSCSLDMTFKLIQIRVSSRISNSQIILNLDCDHYSNNSQSVRDALCFFMDEKQSHNIAFVQYPQRFDNITKNDLYGNYLRVPGEVRVYQKHCKLHKFILS